MKCVDSCAYDYIENAEGKIAYLKRMIISYFPPHALGKVNAFELKLY